MSTKAILEALKAGAKIGKPLKKAVTDFIDDDFPLGTFDDKPFSKLKEQGVIREFSKTRRDGTVVRVKYVGDKKLGTLQPGIRRVPSGPDSTGIVAEFMLKGKKYTKSFSEQKFDDALGEARSFIKNKMKEVYGDDVKLLSNKEFLRILPKYQGMTKVDLADELASLNYITNDQYVKFGSKATNTKNAALLNKYFDQLRGNQTVKGFVKQNPESLTGKPPTRADFTSGGLSSALYRISKNKFKKNFPDEAVKVNALDDQAKIFNNQAQIRAGKAGEDARRTGAKVVRPYTVDHVNSFESFKYKIGADTPELAAYLRNKHNLYGPNFKNNIDVFKGAEKFYKTRVDTDKMLSEFLDEKLQNTPGGMDMLFDHYSIKNLQMVKDAFHGTNQSAIQKMGKSKTAYFESINNALAASQRTARKDKKMKEAINNVIANKNNSKTFKKAMLDGFKQTNDPIFSLKENNFFNLFKTKLHRIERRKPELENRVAKAEEQAKEWLNTLPVEDRVAYVMDSASDGLIVTDARLPSIALPKYGIGGKVTPEDIELEMEMALDEDGEEINQKEAIDRIIERMFNKFSIGGIVGDDDINIVGSSGIGFVDDDMSDVGTIQSLLAGIGAGIIDIPKGAFSLGASLMDLGLGTNHAAKVEKFFDDLTTLDEKAEATLAGNLARIVTNLGIPGAQGFKIGSSLAKQAMVSRKANKYFKLKDKRLNARMKDALNAKGRLLTTLGGAAGIGVADAIFVGDPEQVGTIGDMFGAGPTALTPNTDDDAAREVFNRMKFGLESSLLLGLVGATGSALKTGIKRANDLEDNNGVINKILSKFRPRGDKPQKFFDLERAQIGERSADVNKAQQIQRRVDKHIDAIFPQIKTAFNNTATADRSKLMKQLNEVLLSGELGAGTIAGTLRFGNMDAGLVKAAKERLRKLGSKEENINGIFDAFEDMRADWGEMFTALGDRMDPKTKTDFVKAFGKKFEEYLGTTYQALQNKSIIPIANFKPGQEAIDRAVILFKDAAKTAGKTLTDEEALHYVNKVVETAAIPKGISTASEKTAGVMFNAPDFFINKTVLSDLEFKGIVPISKLKDESRKVIDELLGKVQDPTQTILAGTGRLSLITRRNQFLDALVKNSDESIAKGEKGFFYDDELMAISQFGANNVRKINMDPAGRLAAGVDNPVNGKFTSKGIADALEETSQNILGDGALNTIYSNFILYPKATSQLAKTVLSPITHMRNFISAGAFAAGNGIVPNLEAFQSAFKALQVPGARRDNELYQKLLRLGVVNSNVRLGDLQRLLQDVNFGATSSAVPGLRRLLQQGSRLKKGAEQFYTAEDDFWKITSFAMERQRYEKAFKKAGIKKTTEELDELAADIVRNNIPNYDYVNDFVKGLRKFPVGNFVSFPAEIMRTSANIIKRAVDDIKFVDEATGTAPLRALGYQRLFGFGLTAVAIPYGTVEAAKAIYNVSGAEMDALKRFVPEWSKNSTLVPIRGDDGELKYIDFSHANAYDTMIRPVTTIINNVKNGDDDRTIIQNIFTGMFEATQETLSPFVSEAIWTQAATDIFIRGGRTKEGRRLYTEQTPLGEKVYITAAHLVESQLPGSVSQFKRLGLSVTEKPDEYGREYEFGDEFGGVLGFRAVKVDPVNSMKFKIADFTRGVSNARREFTSPLLKGGPVTPEEIVDRYQIANQQLFKVQREMSKDYYAALTLGSPRSSIDLQFKDRVSNIQLSALKAGRFKPFLPSEGIVKSFADNARKIGQISPYSAAAPTINRLARQYSKVNTLEEGFPFIENPFRRTQETGLPSAVLPSNLPSVVGGPLPTVVGTGAVNTSQKGQQVFGPLDPVFGGS